MRCTPHVSFLACLAAIGCGGDDATIADSSVPADGGSSVAAPEAPRLTPCPGGWREVVVDGVSACDPYPEAGRATCPAFEAHFPGEAGCAPVGASCPAGELPTGLPTGATIRYVSASAPPGGDGSMSAPYQDVTTAVRNAGAGDIVAIGKGTYTGELDVRSGITLWGACPAETRLTSSVPVINGAVVWGLGSDIVVRDLSISGPRPGVVAVDPGVSITLEGVVIDGATTIALAAANGATLRGRSVLVKRVAPAGTRVISVYAQPGGSTIELERTVIEGAVSGALQSEGEGTRLSFTRSAIVDSVGERGALGRGAAALDGATLTLSESVIEDVREVGVIVFDSARAELRDVVLRRIAAEDTGLFGRGIALQDGAEMTLERVMLSEVHETGVLGIVGGRLEAADLLISTTLPTPAGEFGVGVSLTDTPFDLTRVAIFDSHSAAAIFEGASVGALRDFDVRRVVSEPRTGDVGRGISVQLGAMAEMSRVRVRDVREVGLMVTFASATATDIEIDGVAEQDCAATTCASWRSAHGLVAQRESTVDFRRFSITDAAVAGVVLVRGGALDLHEGRVAGNAIGANVQEPGYDIDRLSDQVRFEDNGVNLDSTALPVPDVLMSIEP